eukprot:scaffold9920_cov122-Isochrysis_galbana.AAC.5
MCWVRLRFPEGLRSARSMATGYRFVCLRRKAEVFLVGDVEKCVKPQASVTSIEAMQPSGCRGVQAGRQAEAGCSCALRWQLTTEAARPPGTGLRALARRGC